MKSIRSNMLKSNPSSWDIAGFGTPAGYREGERSPASSRGKVRTNQEDRGPARTRKLTICNWEPSILLLHFELALALSLCILIIPFHVFRVVA